MRINYVIIFTFLQKWKNKNEINSDLEVGRDSDLSYFPGSFAGILFA